MAHKEPTLTMGPIKKDEHRTCSAAGCEQRSRMVVNDKGYCEAHLTDLPDGVSIKVGTSSAIKTNLGRPCV